MTTATLRKPHADRPIEGLMAKWYAANTADMMHEYVELAERMSKQIAEGSKVLEVAPGPGYFCIELARRGRYDITGLDLSRSFVQMAAENALAAGVEVDFVHGSASKMPLFRDTFDFLLCRAAFKNFADPVGALQEMCRVLKPGGRAVLIDMSHDATPAAVDRAVDDMKLSTFNRFLTRLTFKTVLVRSAYTRAEFEQMLAQTAFRTVNIVEEGIGFEITMVK